jgi:hypothetical protein
VGFNFEPASYPRDVVDRDIALGPFDAAEIGAVDAALMGQRLLAQTTLRSKATHIPRQNIPQRPFVSLFHGADFGALTLLRRPLLSQIRYISRVYCGVASDGAGCPHDAFRGSKAMRHVESPNAAVTRGLIEKKLSELLIDDEAGWEAAADWIAARVYECEGIEIGSFDSPGSFATAIMDQLHHQQNLQQRFSRGVDSLNDFEVAEELVWQLVPSGSNFGS